MTKEELLEKAKELAENPDAEGAFFQAKQLRKKWGKVREEEESLYDKEMLEKFNEYLSKINVAEGEAFGSIEERKKDIINRAKETLSLNNFKKATEAMNNLMDEWKASGRTNKEKDDEL